MADLVFKLNIPVSFMFVYLGVISNVNVDMQIIQYKTNKLSYESDEVRVCHMVLYKPMTDALINIDQY